MDALHYLGLLVSVLFIVYQFTSNRRNQHKKLPPSPPGVPIIGHFHLLKNPIHQALSNLSNKYGPIFYLHLGSRPTLVLSSRSAIEECFPNNDIIFSNRAVLQSRKPLQYDHNRAPYGNHWRNIRRFSVIEIFSERRLQMSSEIRIEEIRFMVKHLYTNSFKGVRKVDMKEFFYTIAFNIVMRMVAGKRCFEDDELDLEITKGKLDDLLEMFAPIFTVALGDYFPFLRWLTYYGEERRLLKIHRRKDEFIQALLDAHQNTTSSFTSIDDCKSKTSQTIIDVMLKLKESEPEFYTTDTIKGMIQAMLIAGTHTTANTMESVVPHLISHPDVLQNARDEIDNHVGNSRLINDTDLTKLPYLHCIINETLRLSPVGVLPPRESSEDCTVGGYHIPRGTQLLVNTRAVHRDPELWKEPDRFMPERFLESEEGKERFKYIAFGIGRRICPGEGLGMRVMALSLGTLIQCFDWEEATDESQGLLKTNLNKPKKRPLEIVFQPREALTQVLAQL
ncbi:hypothetical protein LWI29_014655 [Acer saccharum]|uniref:Cytochrome P450 n=1 Tax=Acer saccharum TaxID=4024 RepID=A0AA39SVB6_ACESA|nr:hypothetical protein LWI29_014655 [Acer saccharum]